MVGTVAVRAGGGGRGGGAAAGEEAPGQRGAGSPGDMHRHLACAWRKGPPAIDQSDLAQRTGGFGTSGRVKMGSIADALGTRPKEYTWQVRLSPSKTMIAQRGCPQQCGEGRGKLIAGEYR